MTVTLSEMKTNERDRKSISKKYFFIFRLTFVLVLFVLILMSSLLSLTKCRVLCIDNKETLREDKN